ncbi:carnosine N-methyltransferase isoform X1 [Amborella trichopoda]|uniref:carnosine N-methyltransferase n=2 Tax=Amborella trichopoda TaxID=13333 RepID=U5CX92_AMBTC|nr:carnosine N-methyltransferase isoform X1 [Amborella trichopoda]XP_011626582.1 carnosine N-methyltransferase isoform X1 [Amborella trichopoda]ERN14779.1 hypothetical protein AMTR_s00032p00047690 [Amborella trichopoda]|eukprot:XP_006853312.1 carnosine N-methyltransferase isoform X1 [Amborella trichopoda]
MDERTNNSGLEEALEIQSLRRIISAYLNYAAAAEEDVHRYERSFHKLPPSHKALLPHYLYKCRRLRWCISENGYVILNMLQAFEPPIDMTRNLETGENEPPVSICTTLNEGSCSTDGESTRLNQTSLKKANIEASSMGNFRDSDTRIHTATCSCSSACGACDDKTKVFGCQTYAYSVSEANGKGDCPTFDWWDPSFQLNVPLVDVDKVRCIIRNIVRDWAPEGQRERDQCYRPILEELDRLFPTRRKDRPPSCLVPGAGLGRLALEISCLGFISQGNEFSYYMMICSSFILNHTQRQREWTIYPWIHSNCNSLSDRDQLRPVEFPDIHPASAGITDGFSMCGGDFVEVYGDQSQEGSWDTVVTCFFIDTAHNVVEYIEIISRILRDGGVWINLGPLLYHFADSYGSEDEMSVELSLEDVKRIAFQYGFELEIERTIETTYTANPRSMMQNHYFAAFWTMRKKIQSRSQLHQ